jgi:hypothetical protein
MCKSIKRGQNGGGSLFGIEFAWIETVASSKTGPGDFGDVWLSIIVIW